MALIERCEACATESIHTHTGETGWRGSIDMELVPVEVSPRSDPSTRSIPLLQNILLLHITEVAAGMQPSSVTLLVTPSNEVCSCGRYLDSSRTAGRVLAGLPPRVFQPPCGRRSRAGGDSPRRSKFAPCWRPLQMAKRSATCSLFHSSWRVCALAPFECRAVVLPLLP